MRMKNESKPGPVHKTPADLCKALSSEATTQAAWKDLTPLARNEWICWVISAKQGTTRSRRIQRAVEELQAGKRRPCCWPGCPHRRPSAKKWFERRAR
jgi:uncharacterized protein YdeI (YjbR/CyaY-like superfamily)